LRLEVTYRGAEASGNSLGNAHAGAALAALALPGAYVANLADGLAGKLFLETQAACRIAERTRRAIIVIAALGVAGTDERSVLERFVGHGITSLHGRVEALVRVRGSERTRLNAVHVGSFRDTQGDAQRESIVVPAALVVAARARADAAPGQSARVAFRKTRQAVLTIRIVVARYSNDGFGQLGGGGIGRVHTVGRIAALRC